MNLLRQFVQFVASAALALSGVSASAQSAASLADAAPPGSIPGPALWKVADADTTIYLFGTVHALPKDKPWLDDRIAHAFDSSDELVTEIDVGDLGSSAQALSTKGELPQGQSLRDLMVMHSRLVIL